VSHFWDEFIILRAGQIIGVLGEILNADGGDMGADLGVAIDHLQSRWDWLPRMRNRV
jgi:hypothetical protein